MAKPYVVVEIPGKTEDQYIVLMEGEDLNELIKAADVQLWVREDMVPLKDYANKVRTAADSKLTNNLEDLPRIKRKDLDDLLERPGRRSPRATKAGRRPSGRTKGKS